MIVADPSWLEQKVKKGGFWLSVGALTVYLGLSAWNSWAAANSVLLEVVYGVDIFLAISSCHIGRKIYDTKLGAGLAVMEAEMDKILETSGLKNSDMAERQKVELEGAVRLETRYTELLGATTRFLREEEVKIRAGKAELSDLDPLREAMQKARSSTAQMFAAGLVGSAEGEFSTRPHDLSLPLDKHAEDDRERLVPQSPSS